nr:hypothetical protein [Tanacetum cinerariifolium]
NTKKGFSEEHTPLFPSTLAIQEEEGEGFGHPSEPQPPPSTAQPTKEELIPNVVSSSRQMTQTPRQALNKEWDDRVERAANTTTSLDAEHASGNINRPQSKAMPIVSFPYGISAGGSPRCQESIGGSIAQTRSERVPTPSYDSPLLGVHTPGSDEKSFEQHELTGNIQHKSNDPPLSRSHTLRSGIKDCSRYGDYKIEIESQEAGKKKKKARTPQPLKRRLFKAHSQEDQLGDQLGVLSAAKVFADAARKSVQTYTKRRRTISTGSGGISTASRLFSTDGVVQEVNIPLPVVVKDRGTCKMEESEDEQTKRTKLQQEQDRLGYEAAVRLQEDLDEEERQRMAKRKRYFAAQKAKVKRNKPMTQAQQRAYMSSKVRASELEARSSQATITDFAEVGSFKRVAEAELDYEGSKMQKTNEASGLLREQPDEKENELSQEDLQQMMMVVPVEEVYVEALQVKYPIIDWEV